MNLNILELIKIINVEFHSLKNTIQIKDSSRYANPSEISETNEVKDVCKNILTEKEWFVVRNIFWNKKHSRELADKMHVCQMTIINIKNTALEKIRKAYLHSATKNK